MNREEEILKAKIEVYNSTANDMAKFKLNSKEIEMFSSAMREYARETNIEKDKEIEDLKKENAELKNEIARIVYLSEQPGGYHP